MIETITILGAHWIADFVCQSNKMAQNKSKCLYALSSHVLVYATVMGIMGTLFVKCIDSSNFIAFVSLVFATHWIIDFFTSKLNKHLWEKKEVHWFFVSIGFDQLLHYITLFGIIEYLK